MVKVSVIIPVYNVGDYLEECLDSIVNQTFKDIEIICINDGSTDNSLEILEKYANADDRIKIISQENSGLSATRNNGIELSKGDYIYFMDSDDILELNALEELYNHSKLNDLDIIIFKMIRFYDETGETFKTKSYEMPVMREFDKKVFNYKDLGEKAFSIAVSIPGKFFKLDLIKPMRFAEGLIFEDNLFFAEAMIKAERVSFINKHYYKRRIREGSITTSNTIKFADAVTIVNLIIDLFKREGLYEEYRKPLMENKIRSAHNRLLLVDDEYKEEFFKIIKNDFSNFKEEYENDEVFKNEINEVRRYWFNVIFEVDNPKDYLLRCNLFLQSKKNKDFKIKQKELKKEIKHYAKMNKEISSSKVFNITKPLRKQRG